MHRSLRPEGPIQTGTLRGTRHAFAFLRPDGGGEEVYIAPENLGGGLHGDRVEAVLFRRHPRDFRMEAAVVRILDRGARSYTGNIVRMGRAFLVAPDEALLPERLPLAGVDRRVTAGEKVLFHLADPRRPGEGPRAVIDEIVGEGDDPALDHLVVATQFRLEAAFAAEAEEEAASAVHRGDRSPREDLRSLLTVTIDPPDAKDFDDAISLERLDGGLWGLKVHIADVAQAVTEAGALDREARRRGTSTYFPGHVIPMLPEILSADHLSLRPGLDRRALTVHMRLDDEGELLDWRLGQSWIRSDARLSYDQVLGVLEDRERMDEPLETLLRRMRDVSQAVRRLRFRHGGFDLHVPETEMTLDGRGVPRELWRSRSDESHQIIEEFMILANRAACAFALERELPYIFRVHAEPNPLAVSGFLDLAATLKPALRRRDLETLPQLRRWLAELPQEDPMTRVLHAFFLRSLQKAVYSPIDIGHFGLGISGYGHFTSPIRRYADLWNHRIIKWALRHPRSRPPRRWEEEVGAVAITSSETEARSEAAEREIVRLKTLRWAERHLGETRAGHVVGCLPQGIFVELDDVPVEGFIPRDEIPYPTRFLDGRMGIQVGRTGGDIRPGDPVEVQLVRVDLRQRWLDLALLKGPRRVGRLERALARRGRGGVESRRTRGAKKRRRAGSGKGRRLETARRRRGRRG